MTDQANDKAQRAPDQWYELATGNEEDHPIFQNSIYLRGETKPVDFEVSIGTALTRLRAQFPDIPWTPVFRKYIDGLGLIGDGWDSCGVCDLTCRWADANPDQVRQIFYPSIEEGTYIPIGEGLSDLIIGLVDEATVGAAYEYLHRAQYTQSWTHNRLQGLLHELHTIDYLDRNSEEIAHFKRSVGHQYQSGIITGFDRLGLENSGESGYTLHRTSQIMEVITNHRYALLFNPRLVKDDADLFAVIRLVANATAFYLGEERGERDGTDMLEESGQPFPKIPGLHFAMRDYEKRMCEFAIAAAVEALRVHINGAE